MPDRKATSAGGPKTSLPAVAELAAYPQWVCWRYAERDGLPTKPPLQVSGAYADTTKPETWTTYEAAQAAAPDFDGLGFVVTGSPFCGIDLDHCLRWEQEQPIIAPWADAIVRRLRSYTEITPSQQGLRVWVRAQVAAGRKRGGFGDDGLGAVEIYSGANPGRYFTVTGAVWGDTDGAAIASRQAELDALYAEVFPSEPRPSHLHGPKFAQTSPAPSAADDAALLDRIRQSAQGESFERLWAGDTSEYASPSEADLALCNLLAFWTGRNAIAMDRLFRHSGLMRDKWDRRSGRWKYGERTLDKAIAECRETYSPSTRVGDSAVPHPAARLVRLSPSASTPAKAPELPGTPPASAPDADPTRSTGGFIGGGELLARQLPPLKFLVEGLLVDEGAGFIAAEEKVGKTLLAEHLVTCLTFARPVGGRFAVPERVRVLFVEEEDSLRRTQRRFRKMYRALDIDPDDSAVQAEINQWLRTSVWAGADLDSDTWWGQTLIPEVERFRPAILILDPLSKLSGRNLKAPEEVRPLLNRIDDLRRRFGCVVLIVHHYRKQQGERLGRGSQEIFGSYVLGAWTEQSLFLEPRDRTGKIITMTLQSKDVEPFAAPLRLLIVEANDRITVELTEVPTATLTADRIFDALGTATKSEPVEGFPGVSVTTLALKLKIVDKTVRRHLKTLVDAGLAEEVGRLTKGQKLYAQVEAPKNDPGHGSDVQAEPPVPF